MRQHRAVEGLRGAHGAGIRESTLRRGVRWHGDDPGRLGLLDLEYTPHPPPATTATMAAAAAERIAVLRIHTLPGRSAAGQARTRALRGAASRPA